MIHLGFLFQKLPFIIHWFQSSDAYAEIEHHGTAHRQNQS